MEDPPEFAQEPPNEVEVGTMDGSVSSFDLSSAPNAGAAAPSIRSRTTRFSRLSRANTRASAVEILHDDHEKKTKSIFEWNGGGKNVFICGSWDNFDAKTPMESIKPGKFRIVLPVPGNERAEFKFYVDGKEQVAKDLPYIVNENGEEVNVKHADPSYTVQRGRAKTILSKISGLDLYSPVQRQQVISMMIFRLFYLLSFPGAAYYFYWLIARGGNNNARASWVFFLTAELMSFASAVIGLFGMWKPVKRKWRSLDALKPPLPSENWPSVDIVIAHYKEDCEQLRNTIRASLNLDYPSNLLHVIVADDGYFAAPKVVERSLLGAHMHSMLAGEAGYDPLMSEVLSEDGLVEHYFVKTEESGLGRLDCALECHQIDYGPYGSDKEGPGALPRLSLVARVKPENHHNKAGNINNVLFNADTNGSIILFLDADMVPSENFLLRTIPLLLEELAHDAVERFLPKEYVDAEIGINSALETHWRINRDIAFIQAPQRFYNVDEDDYMAHRNAIFYDGICTGRDGFGLTPFVGTNACWRREVLKEIGGFVYGSVTEDTLTSNEVHNRGYVSRYASEDLCEGEAPVSVAAAMLQRQRWAKGAVMNGFYMFREWRNGRKQRSAQRKRGEIDEYYEYRRSCRRPNNAFVRFMFALDATLYPFLGVSAYLYVFVALYYLGTGEAPIAPNSIAELAGAFIVYYSLRYIAFYSAFWDVSMVDILRGQQTWFSYNVCHVVGVYDALNSNSRLGWVANTGERNRRSWMEWVNIFVTLIIALLVIFRFVAFLAIDGGCRPWNSIGAIFFGLYILVHLYPMVAISVNERLSSASDTERNHKKLNIPIPLITSIATILGVAFLASWAKSPCGIKSQDNFVFVPEDI